jgi:hypothetical protein
MFAQAIYEIRVLLAGYLGSQNTGDMSVRQAAHLAYALHNQAEAVLSGQQADFSGTHSMLRAMDDMLHSNYAKRFSSDLPA